MISEKIKILLILKNVFEDPDVFQIDSIIEEAIEDFRKYFRRNKNTCGLKKLFEKKVERCCLFHNIKKKKK